MASISSPGLGSGLDVKSIVSQLVALERKPIETLQTAKETLQAKLSAFGLLQSYVTNLSDAANVLTKADTWRPTKAVSADAAAVSVTSTASAVPGSYSVEVGVLAQAQALASRVYTTGLASTGTGTLRIELGSWDAGRTTFTPKPTTLPVDVVIAPGQDSLEAVRTAINAANAGVSATIVTDANGPRLAIRSLNSGVENSVRITAPVADAPGPSGASLNELRYDPPNAPAGAMTESLAGRNATAIVNGLPISSASNVLSNVVQGLTITLAKVTTPVTLTVTQDAQAMRKSMEDFVKAYNDINKYVREQTKYDEDSKKASTLQGDRATLSLQSQLRSLVGAGSTSVSVRYSRMSDVGVEIQPDGSLKVNETKFTSATSSANLTEVTRAFTQDGDRDLDDGFAVRLKALASQLTGSGGLVETRTAGLRASIKRNEDLTKRQEERMVQIEARLNRQYGALDTQMAKLTGLNSYISQQITNWNKSS